FLDKGTPYGKSFSIIHTHEGLLLFHQLLRNLEAFTGQKPTVILEATGHYNAPITKFLDEQNYLYVVVNPLLSYPVNLKLIS
uniref:IS110 family transposase n=1 Tax=Paenibacillus sp. UNC451MF TaxID=1449063 RepID=UPI0005602A76